MRLAHAAAVRHPNRLGHPEAVHAGRADDRVDDTVRAWLRGMSLDPDSALVMRTRVSLGTVLMAWLSSSKPKTKPIVPRRLWNRVSV